jgi:hypothetical protein
MDIQMGNQKPVTIEEVGAALMRFAVAGVELSDALSERLITDSELREQLRDVVGTVALALAAEVLVQGTIAKSPHEPDESDAA